MSRPAVPSSPTPAGPMPSSPTPAGPMPSSPNAAGPVPGADPMRPVLYRILRRRQETADTFTIELTPAGGEAIAPFAPGQFNMLYQFGVGESAISISGDPARPERLVHTLRAVGTVTRAMATLRRGDVIGVRGPYGTPWPIDQYPGHDVVIVAGGIGLAPLRPVIYRLLAQRARYGRAVVLCGSRTPADLLYTGEMEAWRKAGLEVEVTVDHGSRDWRGQVGVVTTLIPKAAFDPLRTVAFTCGPEVMMRFTVRALTARDVTESSIFVSMERNMKCAVGMCGHCQLGPTFVCKDGPVFAHDRLARLLALREV